MAKITSTIFGLALAGLTTATAGAAPFVLDAGRTEVLLDPSAPKATHLAADELSALLGRIFDRPVPIVTAPTPGRTAIVLGTNAWSRAAGLAPERLPRDSFQLRVVGARLYIAGCDATAADPESQNYLGVECLWQPQFERGTLFGVYDFLERCAGARFYFPGELGTILPRRTSIAVGRLDVASTPSFSVRRYGYADGPVPEEILDGLSEREFKRLNFYRLRGETTYIPCCHGQNKLFLGQRFGETHPEYLRLCENGRRAPPAAKWEERPRCAFGQLCQSSGIWEEIYKDAKSYFSGEDASVRGIHAADGEPDGYAWGRNASGRTFLDVMPHDGSGRCFCAACQAAYAKAKSRSNYATELVWGKVAALARRLKADGFEGRLTMMAYHPYGAVPDFDLPDNIDVMVAGFGPWAIRSEAVLEQNLSKIRSWQKKLGRKVWLWNYIDKVSCSGTNIPDVPCVSPRAVGAYYQRVKDLVFGAFAESESDRWIYNYLNYYVFGRVAWDTSVDVDAILAEHHRLMFGAGTADMARFFDLLEDLWVGEVAGRARDTPVGPVLVRPDPRRLWTEIYSLANLAKLKACLDGAARAVPAGSLEARRVALFRRHVYEPLVKWPTAYAAAASVPAELARRKSRPDRSIVSNGDFSSMDGWIEEGAPFGSVTVSTNAYVSAPSALLFEMTHPPEAGKSLYLYATQPAAKLRRPLKPDTAYRISFFVKCDRLEPFIKNGGLYVQWWDSSWNWAPRKSMPLAGTIDWTHCAYEIRTRAPFSHDREPFVQLFVTGALGKVYVDDLRFEEIAD